MTKPGEEQPLIDVDELPNDVDYLMSLNPLLLTPAAREAHLDMVIAYHRNLRAAKEKGVKVSTKRGKKAAAAEGEESAKPKIDLAELGIKPKGPIVDRRF